MSKVARSATVEHSILRQGVSVGDHAEVSHCILGENVEIGENCRLRNVIIEADNKVPPGFTIGFDAEHDHEWLPMSEGGVVVIPRGFFSTTVLARAVSSGLGHASLPTITPIGVPTGLPTGASQGIQASKAAGAGPSVMPMMPPLAAGASPLGPRRRDAGTADPQPATRAARA
jgi:hypothetical protein